MTSEQADRLEVARLPASPRRVLVIGLGAVMLGVVLLVGQFWVTSFTNERGIGATGSGGLARDGLDLIEMWEARGSQTPVRAGGAASNQSPAPPVPAAQGPFIVRTIRMTMTVAGFDRTRGAVEAVVREAGGSIASIRTYSEPKEPRMLMTALHIPSVKVESALAAIRALGHVSQEEQDATDVTRQVVDLDARLVNLRTSEARLRALLEGRTGTLADVLAAERELTRVRGELEAMEASRRLIAQQTSFADVRLEIREERNAALDVGAGSVARRLRNAATDGGSLAARVAIGAMLALVRFGPTVLLFAIALAFGARVVRAIRRRPAVP